MEHINISNPRALAFDTTAPDTTIQYIAKRSIDVAISIILLIVLAPLFPIIAILIKLDSRGPAFFVQERVGARRRGLGRNAVWQVAHFRMYKFRTMFYDADQSLHQAHIKAFAAGELDVANGVKLVDDPRITRIGKVLRKTSLDELPQVLNVLMGDMSLIGPRPVPVYEVAEYHDWHYERFTALPGITGLWQIKGRSQVTMDDMIRLDIEYSRNRSVWLDLKIMLLTLPAIMFGNGAG
jgi:lipopolysaccharide/colanic/teichoic acid biosynthesis glycosyltransferase